MSDPRNEIEIDTEMVESAASRAQKLQFPRTRISDVIERFIEGIAWVVNWIWPVLVVIIVATVGMRYITQGNTVWIEEVQWHLYAIGFMLGIGYAIQHDTHVRVDVLASNFRPRVRAVIELLMIVLILFPLIYVIIAHAIPFVERSWVRNETSSAPGGLRNRWAIKAVIVVAFALIGIAALARLMRVLAFLFGFPRPLEHRN